MPPVGTKSGATALVWIEDATGGIVRGHAESVSRGGALVLLATVPTFTPGDAVALRIAFEQGAPTVAAPARVKAVQEGADGSVRCALEWTAAVPALEAWLAPAA